ncbi:MAG: HAD family hydrolase [Chloroflexi bacterium HGW-Chloroflexi-5]|nr:MAG: HAD family hydrolase [Chloroflexi bacterium HGW-Chloroflexi-5]
MTKPTKSPVIVFDFGAVLVDWNQYYLYRKVMANDEEIKAFLDEIDFKNWNLQFDKGYSFEKGVEEKSAAFPQHAEMIKRFNTHWLDAMGEVMMDTVEIARRLKAAGYTLFGLSNWNETKFNLVKDRMIFLDYLDDYVLSGKEKQVKPEPYIFQILLDRIGHKAEECLFIDDSVPNIQTAAKLGFQTIHFNSAQQLAEELTQRGLVF